MQDDWCPADMAISSGATIFCQLKEVSKAVLHVFSAVTKETLPIMGIACLLATSVSKIRSLVFLLLGLPASAFTLSTQSGAELYDCNLDEPVLRFQKRLALYAVAAVGHLEMAIWLPDSDAQAHKLVGVHPSRVWCYETDHPEFLKCPVHAALETGQLHILQMVLGCPQYPGVVQRMHMGQVILWVSGSDITAHSLILSMSSPCCPIISECIRVTTTDASSYPKQKDREKD
ncbi:protein ANKUB1 [Tachysurus ichikawai]